MRKILFSLTLFLPFLTIFFTRPVQATPPAAAPLACDPDGTQASGAIYRLCVPAGWNGGDLIIYAHGYVNPLLPVAIPEDQLIIDGTPISDLINLLGYAFATTSYSTNGLAVQEGIDDIIDLVDIFTAQYGPPQDIYLAGVSEGGIITTLAIERHAALFDGGLAMCGPYGDFGDQVNYFGDFRVLFDYFFPGLMPGDPTNIPSSLMDNWDNHYETIIQPEIDNPANAPQVEQLLTVAGAPYQNGYPISNTLTIAGLLWYNVFATNDARIKLGGQPYTNTGRIYTGSADDATLNQQVARFSADQTALDELATLYQTSGSLTVPLVTLHTTADPIVPYWHSPLYGSKVSTPTLYDHFASERYGHCFFTAEEVLVAFSRLRDMVNAPRIYLPLIFKP